MKAEIRILTGDLLTSAKKAGKNRFFKNYFLQQSLAFHSAFSQNEIIKQLKYSRASKYAAPITADFADTWFLIGSKNWMYTDFLV